MHGLDHTQVQTRTSLQHIAESLKHVDHMQEDTGAGLVVVYRQGDEVSTDRRYKVSYSACRPLSATAVIGSSI